MRSRSDASCSRAAITRRCLGAPSIVAASCSTEGSARRRSLTASGVEEPSGLPLSAAGLTMLTEGTLARVAITPERVRLTSLSHGAGCACKIGAADLAPIVAGLPASQDPRLLIGAETADDAAVYKLSDELAIV